MAQFRGALASAKAQISQIDVTIAQDKKDLARVKKLTDDRLASTALTALDQATRRLQAWDDVTLGGLGATSVGIARHLATEPSPAPSPTPALSPNVTTTATATATAGVAATSR